MCGFLGTPPLPKNAKTDEDKRIKQQYDSNKRVRKFQPSWKAVYKWMSYGEIKCFAPCVVTLSLKHEEWARLLKGRTTSN